MMATVTVVASVTKVIEMVDVDDATKAIKSFAAAAPLTSGWRFGYVDFQIR